MAGFCEGGNEPPGSLKDSKREPLTDCELGLAQLPHCLTGSVSPAADGTGRDGLQLSNGASDLMHTKTSRPAGIDLSGYTRLEKSVKRQLKLKPTCEGGKRVL
ncbi:hypothetical protein ANN_14038 [Periplaneta americana]|uniref:Uncharacterized protein n=1 Tax=Periplaneta americana TaxID=6978 RepID=A0ABQ8SV72_PERAM|nr:hypothetical protein ANN_14038 [Periplaneta americana]